MDTQDPVAICTAAIKNGFVGLLVQALRQAGNAEALGILDQVAAGTATIHFGMTVSGRDCEMMCNLATHAGTREIFAITRTEPPEPLVN